MATVGDDKSQLFKGIITAINAKNGSSLLEFILPEYKEKQLYGVLGGDIRQFNS